ncbi:MAG: hypothetical protein HY043_21035 [Verrucomicrobia bacterium]|nr:hypothetical protein [Verrucomicrobiota bacterium]
MKTKFSRIQTGFLPFAQTRAAKTNAVRGVAAWLCLAACSLLAQSGGTINFNNHVTASNIDAPIFDVDGATRLQGAAFLAQVYAGPDANLLLPVGSPTSFRTGTAAGYVVAQTLTIGNVAAGANAQVQVRAWAAANGSTFNQALAAGGKTGVSGLIQVATGGIGSPPRLPADLIGLQGFQLSLGGPPTVTIAVTDSSASETGSDTGSFTVTRTGSTANALTVNFSVSGSATSGSDYQALGSSVTIPANATGATIKVTPIDDSVFEGTETVVVTLSAGDAYKIGSPNSATVTIADDDQALPPLPPTTGGTVNFNNHVIESNIDAPIFDVDGVTRLQGTACLAQLYGGPSAEKLQAVGAPVAFRTGTAAGYIQGTVETLSNVLPGADAVVQVRAWEAVSGSSFEKASAAGGKSGASALFKVSTGGSGSPPKLPADLVGLLSFRLTSGALPVVTITAADANASETGLDPGKFVVSRTGSSAAALIVNYSTSGSATAGKDYQALAGVVTIPVGQNSAALIVAPLVDTTTESTETIVVTLSPNSAYQIGTAASATVNLTDNNLPPLPPSGGTINFNNHVIAANIDAPVFDVDGVTRLAGEAFLSQLYAGTSGDNLKPVGTSVPFRTGIASGYVVPASSLVIPTILPGTPANVQLRAWAAADGATYDLAKSANGRIGASTVIRVITGGAGTPPKLPADLIGLKSFKLTKGGASSLVIARQPQSLTVNLGADAGFKVLAIGSGSLKFQWQHNGADLPGENGSLLRLNGVTGKQAGAYAVKVSDAQTSIMSDTATLTVVVPSFVTRDLPGSYTPGGKFRVLLKVNPPPGTESFGVTETLPAGWTIGKIGGGGTYDAANNRVVWLFVGTAGHDGGQHNDGESRRLGYEVIPAASDSGPKHFTGLASADGVDSPIVGDDTIDSSLLHPADNNPADNNISLSEFTAYAAAFRRGQAWPSGPSPIPASYVTRAALLYRAGGTYVFDPKHPQPPSCWVSTSQPASGEVRRLKLTSVMGANVVSDLPASYVPTESITVRIPVTPPAGTVSYAIEDVLPAGWTAANISDSGEFDPAENTVRWFFLDSTPRTLTYIATPGADTSGVAAFAGTVSFDGVDQVIAGSRQLAPGSRFGQPAKAAGGAVVLSIRGEIGAHYVVEGSTDLLHWTVVQTAVNTTGILQITESAGGSSRYQFYRAKKVQ